MLFRRALYATFLAKFLNAMLPELPESYHGWKIVATCGRPDRRSQFVPSEAMIFFSSDHHFGHAKVIEYAKRPFASVDEMNERMIELWNETVGEGDDVND